MKTLYLIRGLPGSGKTTLARRLAAAVHFESDQFFETPDGYVYNRAQQGLAHAWCFDRVEEAMVAALPLLVVSNTFSQRWEMAPYRQLATAHGYEVMEITMTGPVRPSIHHVPLEKVAEMRLRWER